MSRGSTTEPVAERRPRLLFITIDLPRDGGSGGQIASWRLLETYARACEIDVITVTPAGTKIHDELARIAGRVELVPTAQFHFARSKVRTIKTFLVSQLGPVPYRVAKFRSKKVAELVRRWEGERRYDLVHCDHLSTAQYRGLLPRVPAILMEHNVEWQILRRLAEARRNPLIRAVVRRDARRTQSYEANSLRSFDHVFTLSAEDRDELLRISPAIERTTSVWPLPIRAPTGPGPRPADRPLTILVLGSLRSVGRVDGLRWFLRAVWPGIRERVPDACLEIVGADPPEDIHRRDGDGGIRVHGYLESLDDVLERSDACAIPLFVGGGIRVKVLELIARGIPCFGTELALTGVNWLPGCIELGSPDEWIHALSGVSDQRVSLSILTLRGAAELGRRHGEGAARDELYRVLENLGVIARQDNPAPLAKAGFG
jgi:glycosyltransferase involved in cell wall biosynthesis